MRWFVAVALVAVLGIFVAGTGTASDALAGMIIAGSVALVMTALGGLAWLIYRIRSPRLHYRPDRGITRVRAEVISTLAGRPEAPAPGPERPSALTSRPGRPALPPARSRPAR